MGKSASKELDEEDLKRLTTNTHFNASEITHWHTIFLKDCPNGKLRKDQLLAIYEGLYPENDAKKLSSLVFKAMDKDNDRSIDFVEFLLALNVLMNGTVEEKLNFAFTVCDGDKSGMIDIQEIHNVVEALIAMPSQRPMVQDNPLVIAQRIFRALDVNDDGEIERSEFIAACLKDRELCEFLTSFYIG